MIVFDSYVEGGGAFVQQVFYISSSKTFSGAGRSKLLMKERKCAKCGASLTDEDVMKVKFEDGSWEVIPLHVCPDCFAKHMAEQARSC